MASNSLLECTVYGWSAAEDILQRLPFIQQAKQVPHWDESRVDDADERVVIQHNWHELRLFMWDYVGIVRTTKRLGAHCAASTRCRRKSTSTTLTSASPTTCWSCAIWCRWPSLSCAAPWRAKRAAACTTLDYPDLLPEALPTILQP